MQAKQLLPHHSTFYLPDILIYLSNLNYEWSPHPNLCLVPLCLASFPLFVIFLPKKILVKFGVGSD